MALAVDDLVASGAFIVAASSEPPPLGIVTAIGPVTVTWQDGREQVYTAADPSGLIKFVPDFSVPGPGDFLNRKVRPNKTGLHKDFANIDHRAEGVVMLTGKVTGGALTDHPVAIIRLNGTGLFVVLSLSEIEVVPGNA